MRAYASHLNRSSFFLHLSTYLRSFPNGTGVAGIKACIIGLKQGRMNPVQARLTAD